MKNLVFDYLWTYFYTTIFNKEKVQEEKKIKGDKNQVKKEKNVCDQMIKNIAGQNNALRKIIKAVNQSKVL